MRPSRAYVWLAAFSLAAATGAAILSGVALALSEPFSALAAGLCAAALLVPGLFLLERTTQLQKRELALAHAGALAEAAGVLSPEDLGRSLHVPPGNAEEILRTAIREGLARGTLDASGRFVATTARRCRDCGEPLPRGAGACPGCGASRSEGEGAG